MNVLPADKRVLILRCLRDGVGVRAAARIADVSKNTVLKLLRDAGRASKAYQDRVLRDLPCRRLQLDEMWSFVYAKQKNVPKAKRPPPAAGDSWLWLALDIDTKLIPAWRVGGRDEVTAQAFLNDLAGCLRHRVQIVSDGLHAYVDAVDTAFGGAVDYAMLVKDFRASDDTVTQQKTHVMGRVPPDQVSTSLIERQNLTMRMSMRWFARRTNAHSKIVENHVHAVALQSMVYNFRRIHETIRVTPAMEASVVDTL